eukprot:4152275-Amphidinium_carterae.1
MHTEECDAASTQQCTITDAYKASTDPLSGQYKCVGCRIDCTNKEQTCLHAQIAKLAGHVDQDDPSTNPFYTAATSPKFVSGASVFLGVVLADISMLSDQLSAAKL